LVEAEIRALELWSFKAFEHFTATMGNEALFVGPNNAGKSTLIAALRASAHMLQFAASRAPKELFDDERHGQFWGYTVTQDSYGLVSENIRHEFHPVETRIEVRFSNKGVLRVVWPLDRAEDE
jgi:ABC-type molybdenum transport system ATPase subunit/photorepair protein PhrA